MCVVIVGLDVVAGLRVDLRIGGRIGNGGCRGSATLTQGEPDEDRGKDQENDAEDRFGHGASPARTVFAKLVTPSPAVRWNQFALPVMVVDPASEMTPIPITRNAVATAMFTVLVRRVWPATRRATGLALPQRRSLRCAASQTRAMISSGITIPKTNARPSSNPPNGLPERADRVITPTRTGAQQLDAMPEKTPRLKNVAESARVVSGARRAEGIDHIVPLSASSPRAIISRPPAQYSGPWYLAMAPAMRLAPRVIGTRTSASPEAKTSVSGSSRHRLFFTAAAR